MVITLRGLLGENEDGNKLMRGRIVGLSAKTGRQIFDTANNTEEHIKKFFSCEVLDIWSSTKQSRSLGFSGEWVQPVIMLFLREKGPCDGCAYKKTDWTNPNNEDCYCSNCASENYGYNVDLIAKCDTKGE